MKSEISVDVKADKSNNYFKMSEDSYNKFSEQIIPKDYKKCTENDLKELRKLRKR